MPPKRYSNIIGFDDAPFAAGYTGHVPVVGTVYSGLQLTGVLVGQVEKDGNDAATRLAGLVAGSKFARHAQLLMLQGIALAGFNVVDVFYLYEQLRLPILVVSRRAPDLAVIQHALISRIRDGEQKWAIIARLGPMEPAGPVYVQRLGLTAGEAALVVERFTLHGYTPEPLRVAHLVAGAIVEGQSHGRP